MNELLSSAGAGVPVVGWLLGALAGLALGAVFFGGLWWTVRRGALSSSPAPWFFGSLLLRMGIALAGFYAVGAGHWQRLLACLLGFVVAQALVVRLTRPRPSVPGAAPQEARHAP